MWLTRAGLAANSGNGHLLPGHWSISQKLRPQEGLDQAHGSEEGPGALSLTCVCSALFRLSSPGSQLQTTFLFPGHFHLGSMTPPLAPFICILLFQRAVETPVSQPLSLILKEGTSNMPAWTECTPGRVTSPCVNSGILESTMKPGGRRGI